MPMSGQAMPSTMDVFLARAFRPFFFAAGLFSGLLLLAWVLMLAGVFAPPSHLSARDWHMHEMIFGFFTAAMTGFLLTAIPNWTGRMPIMGRPLLGLFGLWLAGRGAMFFSAGFAPLAILLDMAFLALLAFLIWREIIAGGNRRNIVVAVLVSGLLLANGLFHAEWATGVALGALAERLALALVAGLIMLIGGRIVPSFTRNWLMKQGIREESRLPAPFGGFDKMAVLAAALALAVWVALPDMVITGVLFAVSAVLHVVRLVRWQGWRTVREPLVWILHVGYLWLAAWMALMGLSIFGFWPFTDALHALTAGAITTMTLAVMTRASRGHSGRPLTADGLTLAIYLLAIAGGVVRVLAAVLPPFMAWHLSATLAILAFWLFAFGYAPMFFRPRPDQFARG